MTTETEKPIEQIQEDVPKSNVGFQIESLIPEDLRNVKKDEEQVTEEPVEKKESPEKISESETIETETESKATDIKLAEDSELDLSTDSIDKLLKGDLDAVVKKDKEETEKPLAWKEDETYKQLVSRHRIDEKTLDELIQKNVESNVLENRNYTEGIQKKLKDLEDDREILVSEIDRYKEIEKAAYFDNSKDTQDKYAKPMNKVIQEMQRIVELEGVDVSLAQLVQAKNRAAFSELFKDKEIDDDKYNTLSNHWRDYKDLEFKYYTDKEQAKKGLNKLLEANIDPETTDKILQNSLFDILKKNPNLKYISDAINEGLDDNEDVAGVLSEGKKDFVAYLETLANPQSFIRDSRYLTTIASRMFENAHSRHIENRYRETETRNKELEGTIKKVVQEYRKLAASGVGIQDKSSGTYARQTSGNGSKSPEEIAKEFEDMQKTGFEKLFKPKR